MKKLLFIDRDGTLILEPPPTYQIDSFEKLEFFPEVFFYLRKIATELDFELVMVTNQDGLGTDSFPENTFWPVHEFILKAFENEGVRFREVLIDRTFAHEKKLTRKPELGLLQHYLQGYDLANSFVIGDRITDVLLAKNLGNRAIWLRNPNDPGAAEVEIGADELRPSIALETSRWQQIYEFLKGGDRVSTRKRHTNETNIEVFLNLDGSGKTDIQTGLCFFDHMLDQIGRHGGIDLRIRCKGDLQVDEHHTMEDVAIALGEAFQEALGNKLGLERYGFLLPMDDCLAQVAIDFGGRPWIVWDARFEREKIGDTPTEMFFHFFKSFSDGARCNLNIRAEGTNEHHKIEAIFKGFARAIKMAIRRDVSSATLPSTKGML